MKFTYNIVKAGFKFTIHSRQYNDETGDPVSDNPSVEFEVLDDKDYTDAEDFFGVMEEITTIADNFDLVASAITYTNYHQLESHTEYDANLADLMDTVLDMITSWNAFDVDEQTFMQIQALSEKLHSLQ